MFIENQILIKEGPNKRALRRYGSRLPLSALRLLVMPRPDPQPLHMVVSRSLSYTWAGPRWNRRRALRLSGVPAERCSRRRETFRKMIYDRLQRLTQLNENGWRSMKNNGALFKFRTSNEHQSGNIKNKTKNTKHINRITFKPYSKQHSNNINSTFNATFNRP